MKTSYIQLFESFKNHFRVVYPLHNIGSVVSTHVFSFWKERNDEHNMCCEIILIYNALKRKQIFN